MIWLTIILSIIGIFDASYLTAKHYLDQSVYCPVGKNCETVLNSAYSTIYGIPIALFGALFYLAVLFIALAFLYTEKRIFLKTFFVITIPALLASLYLVYLQLFVIKAICAYCMVSAANILILFIISIYLNAKNKTLEKSLNANL